MSAGIGRWDLRWRVDEEDGMGGGPNPPTEIGKWEMGMGNLGGSIDGWVGE